MRPATAEVATFLGNPPMNVFPAHLSSGQVTVGDARFAAPRLAHLCERDVLLGVRPSQIKIDTEGLPATVTLCERLGDDVIVDLDVGGLLMRVKVWGRGRVGEGERVHARLDPQKLHVFDNTSGKRFET